MSAEKPLSAVDQAVSDLIDANDRKQDEIDRLKARERKLVEVLSRIRNESDDPWARLWAAEVTQIAPAAIEENDGSELDWTNGIQNVSDEWDKLRAENARLREALTAVYAAISIERYDVAMCRSVLRDALEGKGT